MVQVPPTVSREIAVETDPDEPDTCQETTGDGDVCGRDRPCRYHD